MSDLLHRLRRPLTGLRLLFVCTQNRLRSKTAETVFQGDGFAARSAGTGAIAEVKVDAAILGWADLVFVMEEHHLAHLQAHFADALAGKPVVCLDIPDDYDYMQPELVALLRQKVA